MNLLALCIILSLLLLALRSPSWFTKRLSKSTQHLIDAFLECLCLTMWTGLVAVPSDIQITSKVLFVSGVLLIIVLSLGRFFYSILQMVKE